MIPSICNLRIEGAQLSHASYLRGRFPVRWFPKITLTFLPPRKLEIPPEVKGRRRRAMAQTFLQDLLRDAAWQVRDSGRTLFGALLDARRLYGRRVTLCFPECGNGIDRRITDIIDRIVERLEEVDLERQDVEHTVYVATKQNPWSSGYEPDALPG